VAKTLKCGQSGVLCDATIRGESDEEVLAGAVEHVREKHGVDLAGSSTFQGYLRGLIRDEAGDASREE
jgi:predicted small metal-binding protein